MKLLEVKKSTKTGKKYMAVFENNGRKKTTHFGDSTMQDYTQHGDKQRRENYLSRHKSRENWNDPSTAGSLSRWLLWGDSTSFAQNLRDFKSRFRL